MAVTQPQWQAEAILQSKRVVCYKGVSNMSELTQSTPLRLWREWHAAAREGTATTSIRMSGLCALGRWTCRSFGLFMSQTTASEGN